MKDHASDVRSVGLKYSHINTVQEAGVTWDVHFGKNVI